MDILTRANNLDPNSETVETSLTRRYTSRIFLQRYVPKYEPDAPFSHINAHCPVAMEASFNQKPIDLSTLAEHYILTSQGHISVVIGLDVDSPETRKVTVSAWRSEEGIQDGTPFFQAIQVVDAQVRYKSSWALPC